MRATDIIIKKRDREILSKTEINYFIEGYTRGDIPDYQAAALAMAILLNGMTDQETTDLTLAMAASGETLDLSNVVPIAVDKHSTGGVGDKTTLVVAPIVAACGLPVGKMSGRGLGFSGGTLDKLESIPGYRTDLTTDEFLRQLKEIGIVLTGQSADLAPADGKLYALRDVTGTVQSIPLIASSVMSKKIAAGAQAIVLDVKVGLGAFMTDLEQAQKLSRLMVTIAKLAGRKAVAIISDMNQPLGEAVGNALELKEAIATLHGKGPEDIWQHCLEISAQMLVIGSQAGDLPAARKLTQESIDSGRAWQLFRNLVQAQGGDLAYIDEPERLPQASVVDTVTSPHTGFLSQINARLIGEASVALGAGRARKDDPIDYAVGIEVLHKVGDYIDRGMPIMKIHANRKETLQAAREMTLKACAWSKTPVKSLPLFYDLIEEE
jgi:pyrimidine-nucleoside phosphorylase